MIVRNEKKIIKLDKRIVKLQYKIKLNEDKINNLKEESNRINESIKEKELKSIEKKKQKVILKEQKLLKKRENKIKNHKLNEPPHLSILEEIGNGVTHGVGAILAIVALVLMLIKSNNIYEYISAIVYGSSIFVMMLFSCLYHAFRFGSTVKFLFRRFDYSSIYLLIGGTFAPLFLIYLDDKTMGLILFIVQWVLIITGITFVSIYGPGRLKWLHFPLYFIMGWSGAIFIPRWISNDFNLFLYVLIGGLIYTIGMIPFVMRGKKSAHFIWHFAVLFGCVVQFIGIYLYVF